MIQIELHFVTHIQNVEKDPDTLTQQDVIQSDTEDAGLWILEKTAQRTVSSELK